MADKKYYIMNTVWEVWSNSDHKTNYSFGLYDSKPTADEVYQEMIKAGIIPQITGSSPLSGVREVSVFGRPFG
jgi:hypothetical protein